MDIITVDQSDFSAAKLVNGWSTMVWTERYLPAGEFELRTSRIAETMALLPEDSLFSLRDAKEVMQVENIVVETNEEGVEEAIFTGRTMEAPMFEGRVISEGDYKDPFQMLSDNMNEAPSDSISIGKTPVEAAAALAWNALVNTSGTSMIRAGKGNYWQNNIGNMIMMITGDENVGNRHWWLENGPLYERIQDLLIQGGTGVRNIRPPFTPTNPLTQYFDMVNPGEIVRRGRDPLNRSFLQMDFYKGVDRSVGQNAVPPVVFDWRKGDLEKPRYLFSNKNRMTMCTVMTDAGPFTVYRDSVTDPNKTGRNRRHMLVDGGTQGDLTQAQFFDASVQKGQIELKKADRIAAMEAGISGTSKAKYGVDYFLGDFVTLRGNYGFNQKMQVSEYVRGSDGTVDRGYPTLIIAN